MPTRAIIEMSDVSEDTENDFEKNQTNLERLNF